MNKSHKQLFGTKDGSELRKRLMLANFFGGRKKEKPKMEFSLREPSRGIFNLSLLSEEI